MEVGHARVVPIPARVISPCKVNIPDVPCLGDSSTSGGGPRELDSAIVINSCNRVRASKEVRTVFAVRVAFNHNAITNMTLMGDACSVFALIVLND